MRLTAKIIFEFPKCLDKPPVVYPVADSDEDAEKLRRFADKIAAKGCDK